MSMIVKVTDLIGNIVDRVITRLVNPNHEGPWTL